MNPSRIYRGVKGEAVFRGLAIAALFLLSLYFAAIFLSLFTYTDARNIAAILGTSELQHSIRLSLFTASLSSFAALALGIPAAYALSQSRFRGKAVLDALLDLPIVVSPVALGAAMLVFFNSPPGSAIERHFLRFVFEIPGIVLAQFTVVSAFSIRLLKSTFDGIDHRYEQVARTLGCGKFRAFFRVTVPLARNGLIAAAIMTWSRAIGEFGATITLAGAMKGKTDTLPVAIFLSLSTANIEKAIALILVLVSTATSALLLLHRLTSTEPAS
jgi:molybdate transport system permease protein